MSESAILTLLVWMTRSLCPLPEWAIGGLWTLVGIVWVLTILVMAMEFFNQNPPSGER